MKRLAVAAVAGVILLTAATQTNGQLLRRFRTSLRSCASCQATETEAAQEQIDGGAAVPSGFGAQDDDPAPQVDEAEVLRMGDVVQHIDGLRRAGPADDFVEVMGPPENDSDKWFISVITTKGCAACERLKRDWAQSPWLLALAAPDDPKESWAHFNVYLREDASQAWRFENIQLTEFPTIVVQPPRNGRYGDPSTVVFQGTYGGDPRQLAQDISRAIRLYLKKMNTAQGHFGQGDDNNIGVDPPWSPPSRDDGRFPLRPDRDRRPLIPPIPVEHEFKLPWQAIIKLLTAGFSVPAVIALVVWLIYFIRERRKEQGKTLLLDDQAFERLIELLENFAEAEQETQRSKPRSTNRTRKTTKRKRTTSSR